MLIDQFKTVIKYLIFLSVVFLIYYSVPKKSRYSFDIRKNEIWHKSDLVAPFSFPVLKTEEEIESEKNEIYRNFKPFFRLNSHIYPKVLTDFYNKLPVYSDNDNQSLILLKNQIEKFYSSGIYNPKDINSKFNSGIIMLILPDNSVVEKSLNDLYTMETAESIIESIIQNDSFLKKIFTPYNTNMLIIPNLEYDQKLTEQQLSSKLSEILPYSGIIEKGEIIIERGSKITEEKYQKVISLMQKYEGIGQESKINYFNHAGYLVIILLLFVVFIVYIIQFYRQIYNTNKDLLLIFSIILIFILLSSYLIKNTSFSIYLIPFCIVPIIIISFFEARIAFFSHVIVVATVSLFVPNAHEFFLIQIISGLSVVILISRVRYISQFFISVLVLLGIYAVSFLGINILKINSFSEIQWTELLWLVGNFVLTLLAYPMIYAVEKLFGKISDLSLIELSDVNKKLLKEFAAKAPGTFQHSIQLANLTEAVIAKIGGNSLLARVGCLYHDIGKMYAPSYFIENQKDTNPFDKIDSEKECASIIIRHVPEGVAIAKEYKLPREVIHFIKTHHGTTRVEYFYRKYIKKNPDDQQAENHFRYPGPKPTSKEMAVVMIADSVEAATRSLKETTPEALDNLVDSLVDQKMKDNQFQNANITLKDIRIAKEIIKNKLRSVYHQRIEYPSEN